MDFNPATAYNDMHWVVIVGHTEGYTRTFGTGNSADYYNAACKRMELERKQMKFDFEMTGADE